VEEILCQEDDLMPGGIQIPFYQVDAFTDRPFSGNPAAVCILAAPLPAETMQAVAAEMNLSETAFVQPPGPEGIRPLRWFTPKVEVPLCGHATLATAHALLREEGASAPVRFETLSGILSVGEEESGWLRMDFPVDAPAPARPPEGLLEFLGCPPSTPTLLGVKGWIVRLPTEEDVRTIDPDFTRLGGVDVGNTALGVIVTAPGDDDGVDFVSRFFGPWVGVNEDPVTGMAHTLLTPYWAAETGRGVMKARQISSRGGELRVTVGGDRVQVSGRAVTVVRGSLSLP
jgi:PhzF family phenazine biosynthesis protein